MFYVYILQSLKNGRMYIGQTKDIKKRLLRHNNGFCLATRYYRPYQLIYSERYNSLREVIRRERYLKLLKSPKAVWKIINSS
ncbi:MAG: GIY-YIG nuclease family protein [Patescibacteria group bacterium]|jgi:putative endonuclease